ncbi:MAG: hypothetical protein ACK4NR_05325 [Micavibrio sp.]
MSDSGSSQFPTRPPITDLASIVSAKLEIKGQILALSARLSQLSAPLSIEGKVEQVQKDGTVTVRTEQGDITFKTRDRALPAQGQTVEVNLPAGSPPRQINIRPAPAPSTSTPAPPQNQSSAPDVKIGEGLPPAPRATLDQSTQVKLAEHTQTRQAAPITTSAAPVTTSPREIIENALLRLTPLPPDQIKLIVAAIKAQSVPPLPAQAEPQAISLPPGTLLNSRTQTAASAALLPQTPKASLPVLTVPATALEGFPAIPALSVLLDKPFSTLSVPDNSSYPAPSPTSTPALEISALKNFLGQPPYAADSPLTTIGQFRLSPLLTPTLKGLNLLSLALGNTALKIPMGEREAGNNPAINAPSPLLIKPQTTHTTNPTALGNLKSFMDVRVGSLTPAPITFTAPQDSKAPALLNGYQQITLAATTQTAPTPFTINTLFAGQISGQVIGTTPHHFPVISFNPLNAEQPLLFTLNISASNLAAGQQISFTPLSMSAALKIPLTPPSVFELLGGSSWPAFDELTLTPNIQMASSTTNMLANILPSPAQPAKIPAAALLFIAAVRAGDLQSWLGEKNIDHLRRIGKTEFVNRMTREFSGLNRLSHEPVTSEWRAMVLPFYHQEHIEKVHLYYRSDSHEHDGDNPSKGKGARFVMDLDLSAIGPIQLDGLARGKVLDLAIRSQQPFSTAMRHEMTGRYIKTLEAVGLEGSLIFQAQPEKWVKITPRQDILTTSA